MSRTLTSSSKINGISEKAITRGMKTLEDLELQGYVQSASNQPDLNVLTNQIPNFGQDTEQTTIQDDLSQLLQLLSENSNDPSTFNTIISKLDTLNSKVNTELTLDKTKFPDMDYNIKTLKEQMTPLMGYLQNKGIIDGKVKILENTLENHNKNRIKTRSEQNEASEKEFRNSLIQNIREIPASNQEMIRSIRYDDNINNNNYEELLTTLRDPNTKITAKNIKDAIKMIYDSDVNEPGFFDFLTHVRDNINILAKKQDRLDKKTIQAERQRFNAIYTNIKNNMQDKSNNVEELSDDGAEGNLLQVLDKTDKLFNNVPPATKNRGLTSAVAMAGQSAFNLFRKGGFNNNDLLKELGQPQKKGKGIYGGMVNGDLMLQIGDALRVFLRKLIEENRDAPLNNIVVIADHLQDNIHAILANAPVQNPPIVVHNNNNNNLGGAPNNNAQVRNWAFAIIGAMNVVSILSVVKNTISNKIFGDGDGRIEYRMSNEEAQAMIINQQEQISKLKATSASDNVLITQLHGENLQLADSLAKAISPIDNADRDGLFGMMNQTNFILLTFITTIIMVIIKLTRNPQRRIEGPPITRAIEYNEDEPLNTPERHPLHIVPVREEPAPVITEPVPEPVGRVRKETPLRRKKKPKGGEIYDGGNILDQNGPTRNVASMLGKYGNDQVIGVTVVRQLIPTYINMIYNKLLPYDKLYHLSMQIKVNHNGYLKILKLEKQSFVSLSETINFPADAEYVEIQPPFDKTLNESFALMSNVFPSALWSYNAIQNNCQVFVMMYLSSLNKINENIKAFVLQDKIQNYKNPYVEKFSLFVTRMHGLVKGSLFGGSLNANQQLQKRTQRKEDSMEDMNLWNEVANHKKFKPVTSGTASRKNLRLLY